MTFDTIVAGMTDTMTKSALKIKRFLSMAEYNRYSQAWKQERLQMGYIFIVTVDKNRELRVFRRNDTRQIVEVMKTPAGFVILRNDAFNPSASR